MVLRIVAASDDDIDAAGVALADADFWRGNDAEVDAINGVNPQLRDIMVWEHGDALDDYTNVRTRGTFQLNTWPNTRRLTVFGEWGGISATETATLPINPMHIHNSTMDIQMEAGDDWVSDGSVIYSSDTNSVVTGAAFCYSYGTRYPWSGKPLQWIRKVAGAAEGGADAVYEAWTSDLTGTAPGLDPHKQYILRGVGHEAAATAKGGIGAWAAPQASAYEIFGPAIGDFAISMHVFTYDGIPVNGQDGFTAYTGSHGAADTPYVWLGFEELGATPGKSAGTAGASGPAPVGGKLGNIGKIGGNFGSGIFNLGR